MSVNKVLCDIKNGNDKAFESLFHNYYKNLVIYAYSILNDKEWAEDTVQEFFVNFWCKREKIIVVNSLDGYLYNSIKYACVNQLRIKKHVNCNFDNLDSGISELSMEENYTRDEHNELYKAINFLPIKRRKIFIMYNFRNLSYKEIAESLNISVNTVRTQLSRACKSVKKHLELRIFP